MNGIIGQGFFSKEPVMSITEYTRLIDERLKLWREGESKRLSLYGEAIILVGSREEAKKYEKFFTDYYRKHYEHQKQNNQPNPN